MDRGWGLAGCWCRSIPVGLCHFTEISHLLGNYSETHKVDFGDKKSRKFPTLSEQLALDTSRRHLLFWKSVNIYPGSVIGMSQ